MSQLTTDPAEIARMARRVLELRTEHRDLDEVITRLQADPTHDQLMVCRLKKRKLRLKDQIHYLEGAMTPDEPA
jgi:hypothetical protein